MPSLEEGTSLRDSPALANGTMIKAGASLAP